MEKRWLKSGLSMIEILIVTAIIGVLVVVGVSTLPQQMRKGRDAERKSDLQEIKVAFENYYSDNDCYPGPEILDNCGGSDLSPYLASVPCDPQTQTKYLYAPEESSCPHYYRVFANLEIDSDPIVAELGCNNDLGCGAYEFFEEELGNLALEYNYGVSEGAPVHSGSGTIPPGTSGWCCSSPMDQCNAWTSGNGVCVQFFYDLEICNTACGYAGP